MADFRLDSDVLKVSDRFGKGGAKSLFQNAGFMRDFDVWTRSVEPVFDGHQTLLGHILEPHDSVPEEYFVPADQLDDWRYLKGAKNEERKHKASGTSYFYAEGALPFPDPLDRPGRTILTGEGGTSPSRFKHIIDAGRGAIASHPRRTRAAG